MKELRIERFITFDIYMPFIKTFSKKTEISVPILMYHSISYQSFPGRNSYYQIHTSPEVFHSHMDYLKKNNYKVVSLTEAINKLFSRSIDDKMITLTFDDAYKDIIENAVPILKNYQFPATVFVPTSLVGMKSQKLLNKQILDWNELKEIVENNMEIGSHSVTHQNLHKMSEENMRYELESSKNLLEEKLNRQIINFSFPYAFPENHKSFISRYNSALENAGYCNAVTTRIGMTRIKDGKYGIRRIPINDIDDLNMFCGKIVGGYDWMYYIQRLKKNITR